MAKCKALTESAVKGLSWLLLHSVLVTCVLNSLPRVGSGAVSIGPTPFPDRRS